MAEKNINPLEHSGINKQEDEIRTLFQQLILQELSATAEDLLAEEETKRGSELFSGRLSRADGRFIPPQNPVDCTMLLSNSFQEEELEEDDILPDVLPLVYVSDDDIPEDDESDLTQVDSSAVADEPTTPARRNPFAVFWGALCDNVPLVGDRAGEVVRKSVFWLSVVLCAGALTYILYHVWWLPAYTDGMYTEIEQTYNPDLIGTVEEGDYPQKMQLSFQSLYERNPETRGWLSYHAGGTRDFLNIDYPIMYSGDNDKYLTVDFNGNKNKNGALFFDMRAQLESPEDQNRVLIAYGHNMASGQMLAGLNKFIGNVNNARVASTLTMNTLFGNGEYKVLAVVITDEDARGKRYFNTRRTQFVDDEDFLQYVADLRARSLFDYPVDVQADDELLMLTTCTAPSAAKVSNGRLTVVARRVRAGEIAAVDTAAIVKNTDVIMPYAWYELQKQPVHAYYMNTTPTTAQASTTSSALQTDFAGSSTDTTASSATSTSVGTTTATTTTTATPTARPTTAVAATTTTAASTTTTTTATTAQTTTAAERTTVTTTAASTTASTTTVASTAAQTTTTTSAATTTTTASTAAPSTTPTSTEVTQTASSSVLTEP